MRRYPFMNNNGCQIYCILLPNLLVWIEIINFQKLVTHVMHCLSDIEYLYVCYRAAPGSFKVPDQPRACPVRQATRIWLWVLKQLGIKRIAQGHVRQNDFQSGGGPDFWSQKWHISADQSQCDSAGHCACTMQGVSEGGCAPSEVGAFWKCRLKWSNLVHYFSSC